MFSIRINGQIKQEIIIFKSVMEMLLNLTLKNIKSTERDEVNAGMVSFTPLLYKVQNLNMDSKLDEK